MEGDILARIASDLSIRADRHRSAAGVRPLLASARPHQSDRQTLHQGKSVSMTTQESIRTSAPSRAPENMVWIPGGTFRMGSDHHYPEEAPAHNVKVPGFWIARHTVTNAEFKRFVDDTAYVTLAER